MRLLDFRQGRERNLHDGVARVEENLAAGREDKLVDEHLLDHARHAHGGHPSIQAVVPEVRNETISEIHALRRHTNPGEHTPMRKVRNQST